MIPLCRAILSGLPRLAMLLCAMLPLLSSADSCPEISRAGFTGAIAGSEPMDTLNQVPENLRTLFFFTDVVGGAGMTLQHRWRSGDSDTEVSLRVGGSGGRIWSSRQIVNPGADWHVTVTSDTGCELGVWRIGGNPDAAPRPRPPTAPLSTAPAESTPAPARVTIPARAQTSAQPAPAVALKTEEMNALLSDRDLVGVRMLLETEADRGVDPQLLTRIRQIDLEIASAKREIEADRLYTAATRLTQLAARQDLTGEERSTVAELQEQVGTRTSELESSYVLWLAAWEQTMNRGLAGGALCSDPSAFASDWPERITGALSWVDRQTTTTGYDFVLIDTRTGRSHVLSLHCPMQGTSALVRQ